MKKVRICRLCGKVLSKEGVWVSVSEIKERLPQEAIWTYCPDCKNPE
ncbi:MAG: hypothetical protein PHN37_02360 [Candidatus Pacebacteria bacterium]|nr:hypothetical protein [Candidatus Paceibacterota bacterium]